MNNTYIFKFESKQVILLNIVKCHGEKRGFIYQEEGQNQIL